MDTKSLATRLAVKHNTRDPFRIADDLGFITIVTPLEDMRGFQQTAKRRKFIYVNSKLGRHQQQLVCAHELGHHFCHKGMNRMFMDRCTYVVTERYENEAHQFSVDLVYGDDDLQPFLNRSIPDAAAYMGIPARLAEYRMSTVSPQYIEDFGC